MRRPCPAPTAIAGLVLAIALGGCSLPRTPSQAIQTDKGSPTAAARPQGVHLASLTIVELNTDYGVAVAIEPQTATFPAGDAQFEVLNKWHGLPPGAHTERVRVLTEDGARVLFTDETAFEVKPQHLTVTVVEVVALTGAPPGLYWVAVDLDGEEMTRYTFRLVPEESAEP